MEDQHGHIPARDAAFETYVKGVYNFAQDSDAGKVFGRSYYIYYTQAQINMFSYAPNKPITRTAGNEKEIFTYVENSGGTTGSTTIDGYEFKTYTSSNGKTYIWYMQNVGSWSGVNNFANVGCHYTSISIIASGYGKETLPSWNRNMSELQYTSTNLGTQCLGTGGNPKGFVETLSPQQLAEIKECLYNGGEVIVHVLGKSFGGATIYTSTQHWMPVVDISEDGEQVFIMNTSTLYSDDKNGWTDINTLFKYVNCYHLISGIK